MSGQDFAKDHNKIDFNFYCTQAKEYSNCQLRLTTSTQTLTMVRFISFGSDRNTDPALVVLRKSQGRSTLEQIPLRSQKATRRNQDRAGSTTSTKDRRRCFLKTHKNVRLLRAHLHLLHEPRTTLLTSNPDTTCASQSPASSPSSMSTSATSCENSTPRRSTSRWTCDQNRRERSGGG